MLSKILARTSHGICMAFLCLKLSSNLKERILSLVKSIHARIAEMVLLRYTLSVKLVFLHQQYNNFGISL